MQAHPPGPTGRAAAVLRDRREEIMGAWEEAVRASPAGPRLDGPSLRDHVSEILDRVAAILAPLASMDGDPREHGRTRAAQGIGVVPVLAELGVLRKVVLEAWNREGGLDLDAVRALDQVVDEAAMEAARRISDTHDAFFRGVDAISRASLESRDTDELLRRLLEEIVRTSRAVDSAVIFLRKGDLLVGRAAVGATEWMKRERPLRIGEGFAGRIAAEVRPILVEDASADPDVTADDLPRRDLRALYGVPLVHRGEVIGVAYMGSLHATGLAPEDRRLFESMASRAALAVARQLALDQERRHREELALLSRISRDMVERMELQDRLRRAAEAVVPAFADWCAVALVEGGAAPHLAVHTADPAQAELARESLSRAFDASAARGAARVVREGIPELIEDVEELGSESGWSEESRRLLRRLGIRSYLAVPLSLEPGVIGVLAFGMTTSSRRFDSSSVELALELGRRVAVAVENARLFERARREALLREHVLAVVSHDLRNPLASALMAAATIEATAAGLPQRADLLRATQAIRRAARRMERLIADLVDAAVIQSGRLSVSPQPHAPGELVREAVDSMQPLARERGLALGTSVAPDLPRVLADRDRILQVLGNILSNAVDVTPSGGRVDVRADAGEGAVRFSISDTGPGLAAEEAEHVFEAYRRGSAPGYKGTGLGLAIARGIVAAHGGRIGLDTVAGGGATFWFTLPLAGQESRAG
ncbi:MAG TPA: GAF domain-containing protein [Anaeromyxobacter sp.]